MKSCEVAVIGAGLAGLYAARTLARSAVDVLVIEARDRCGGRVLTVDSCGAPSEDGFDLGPSWYWPQMQPAIADLISELGLRSFVQHIAGEVIFERPHHRAQRFQPLSQEPPSMRLEGGTGAVVRAVARELPADSVLLRTRLKTMALAEHGVRLTVENGSGEQAFISAGHVIAALPPRLLEASVAFVPPQERRTSGRWRSTPTWMAPHAKFFAIYDQPFWRTAGLSGTAQSIVGPMAEIHDATTASGKAALFGFVGVSAEQRAEVGEDTLKTACLAQLERLFGSLARNPSAILLKDWAADPLTATATDHSATGHPLAGDDVWVTGEWQGRLSLAGSETSPTEPGYLSGAITAAKHAVSRYLEIHRHLR